MFRLCKILAIVLLISAPAFAQTVQPWVSGTASSTNTAAHTLIAAPGGNGPVATALYISGMQCGRNDAGTTAINVTFNDVNATVMVLPNTGGGGGNNMVLLTPISPGPNTAFTFTVSAGTTTVTCNAQGFIR